MCYCEAGKLTLHDLLSDARIRTKGTEAGRNYHTICPKCGGGSTREVSLSVSFDEDGHGFTCVCHRGSCGYRDGKRVQTDGAPAPRRPSQPLKPPPHASTVERNRPEWLYDFFGQRNIGAKTVNDFGLYAIDRTFPQIGRSPAIVFPYTINGEVVNRKYRPHPAKQPQAQESGALPSLFNVDRLGEKPEAVVWVEGEPDVLALYESGYPNAVTLKDGAPAPGQKDDKRYEALRTHEAILKDVQRFYLAGDMDAPGLALREELARRLGRHRCWLVTWPEGCKDVCDTLTAHGPDVVRECIETATPYPIDGLQKVEPGLLARLKAQPSPPTLTTGVKCVDDSLSLPAEGRLIIVSGWPGSGKSNWTRYTMIHTMQAHGRKWAVFSPEMQPWEQFVAECAEVYIGKPFRPPPVHGGMDNADLARAERFLAEYLTVLASDAEDHSPTIDWILEMARIAVLREGITDLQIDPWNELAHERPKDQTETDYIGRCLQRLKAFGLRHGVNIWIVVHPAKPFGIKQGDSVKPVGPFDLAASAHWNNKADLGLTLHVPDKGKSELHVWKSRFRRWSERGALFRLNFNPFLGIYSTGTWLPEED